MSEFCLESMRDAGITEIAVIVGGNGSEKVREYYGNGEKLNLKITYVEQEYPKGIAHAISLCKNFIGEDKFLVFLGDNIIQKSIKSIAEKFVNDSSSASILLCEVENPSRFGIADVKNGKILKIMEKPKNPPTNLAVTGIYFLTPKIFDVINRLKPSWRNEYEITDALDMLLKEGNAITYDIITDYWKDTGTPEDIINANKEILKNMKPIFQGEKEEHVSISGNVIINSGTKIKRNCKITGPVIIGRNCILEEDTIIGPNTSIGDNSKISKSNIENSIIMESCEIMSNIKIRNSIISANSKIYKAENEERILLLGEGTNIKI
jgi:glucose-1-phosphate thymidylyltransferase